MVDVRALVLGAVLMMAACFDPSSAGGDSGLTAAGTTTSTGGGGETCMGAAGCDCYPNSTCDTDLECDPSGRCVPHECTAGTAGCPCIEGACLDPLVCEAQLCVPSGAGESSGGNDSTGGASSSGGGSEGGPSTCDPGSEPSGISTVDVCPDVVGSPLCSEGAEHVAQDSVIDWLHDPPASGTHYPTWETWGEHSEVVPRGNWVHNLEHGGIVLLHRCPDGCPELDTLRMVIAMRPDLRILMTLDPLLPGDDRFAALSWTWSLRFDSPDLAQLLCFADQHENHAPEDVFP